MVSSRIYNLMYRFWAPWDKIGVREDLVRLLEERDIGPNAYPRSVDLGCGSGANVVYLSEQGFDAYGIDFSTVGIAKAEQRAAASGVHPTFVVGDLTSLEIAGVDGSFDLIIDFGTLDDLRGEARRAMAATATRLARPGTLFLEYCFFGVTEELPRFSFSGTSKLSHIAPGEMDELFGNEWEIEVFSEHPRWRIKVFLLTKR